MRLRSRFFFCLFVCFAYWCPIAPALFVKKTVFLLLNYFFTFVKNKLDIFQWAYFGVLYFVPCVCVYLFSNSYSLDY